MAGGEKLYRVLIVDDEPFMLEGMRLMIDWEAHGFELCGEAQSAQEAIQLVDSRHPHLLITDIKMPGMLGTDLASIVRRYHPETVILFFSGHRDFDFIQSAIRTHAFGYLLKPIDSDEVHATLERVKAQLDATHQQPKNEYKPAALLFDQVLRRIAFGDDSSASLVRAGVLLHIKRNDPCYCAILMFQHTEIPASAKLLVSACGATAFQLSGNQLGLCFHQPEHDLHLLEQLSLSIGAAATPLISVGMVHFGVQGFAKSMREALNAQGVLYHRKGVLRIYQPVDANAALWIAQMRVTRLCDALQHESTESMDDLYRDFMRAADKINPSLFSLRYMAFSLETMLSIANQSSELLNLRTLWLQDDLCRSDWIDRFFAVLRALKPQLSSQQVNAWPDVVRATLSIVDSRYPEPLSLSTIAHEIHINTAYLGQLIKKHTGTTFSHHLLDIRIKHACILLRQTTTPIQQIALDVGFRDADYFSQKFRQKKNVSPMTYRNADGLKEDEHAAH